MMRKTVIVFGLLGTISMILLGCALEPPPPTPIFDAVEATPTSQLSMSVEHIQVAARYPLEVEGEILQDNPAAVYWVPEWSPNGRTMLFRQSAGSVPCYEGAAKCYAPVYNLWRTDAQGKSSTLLAEQVALAAWSPDSTRIAYMRRAETGQVSLWIMQADGTEHKLLTEDISHNNPCLDWLEDDIVVYFGKDDVVVGKSLKGAVVKQLTPPDLMIDPFVGTFALSPQGDRAIFGMGPELWLVPFDTQRPITITSYLGAFSGINEGIAWSPKGSRIAYSSRSSIYFVDDEGQNISEIKTVWEPSDLVWSPDSKLLAFIGRAEERGFSYEIYLVDTEHMAIKQLTHDREENIQGYKNSLTWSPDGLMLIYGTARLPGQKVQVIELTTTSSQGRGSQSNNLEEPLSLPFVPIPFSRLTQVLSDCPYQAENDGTIWILREEYGNEMVNIPFDMGIAADITLSNYLGGVLEYEIGGTRETPLRSWQSEAAKATAVAARTVALYWCPRTTVSYGNNTHYGLTDHSYQHYNPDWSADRAAEYRAFVADTAGEYLTYEGNLISGLQYRTYTGRNTVNTEPNGPHKEIYDPVAAEDETRGTGMGQHSANHWMMGLHNEQLDDAVNVPNITWQSYKQILPHYYTDIQIERAGTRLTPFMRFNVLTATMQPDTSIVNYGESYQFQFTIQNTGTSPWRIAETNDYYALSYHWQDAAGHSHNTTTRVKVTTMAIDPGDPWTVTITVADVPATWRGAGVVAFDMLYRSPMLRTDAAPHAPVDDWFSAQNQAWFTYDIPVCYNGPCSIALPVVMKNMASTLVSVEQAYPAPGFALP